jgi:hypothetical protein
MRSRPTSTALALVLGLVATAALGGCSLFATPDPPSVVTTAVNEALSDLRATDGVAEANGDASPIDSMWGGAILDDPDSWIARFTITADSNVADLSTLADDIDETLSTARGTVTSAANVRVEADGSTASVLLELSTEPTISVADMVAAATLLREIDGAEAVSTYPTPATVVVGAPEGLAEVAAELRALPGFGTGGLHAVSLSSTATSGERTDVSVTLDAVSPAPALIEEFEQIGSTAGVNRATLDGVRPAYPVDESGTWRPSLTIAADRATQVDAIVERLVALPDAATAVAGVPRAAFRVTDSRLVTEVSGFVGLPLGSEAPADGVPVPSATSTPPPVDPVLAAARFEEGRVLVASLLGEAGDLAGIQGTATLDTIPCADDRGAQATGSVVIPIFEIADRADDAFARITEAWTDRGYEYADRAMGTHAYAAQGLELLTIRGTAEGIRISATADCTVLR